VNDYEDDSPAEEGGGVFEPEAGLAVWVQADKCTTCVFHPGNRMHLEPGRVKQMVAESVAQEGHITCHDTLLYSYGTRLRPAVCRGYFDHPQGNERSLALRFGRAMGTIHYQQPTKEPSMLLADLLADTGLTMTAVPGEVRAHSTGWVARDWAITYRAGDKSVDTSCHLGDVDETPTLLEMLTDTLDVVRLVREAGTYEDWGRELGGEDPRQWPPREGYDRGVQLARAMKEFLGEDVLKRYLKAQGVNTADHEDQAPTNLDMLLPGSDIARAVPDDVMWMIPDCTHQHADREGQLCTWRVLAVHPHRVALAALVEETDGGYRAVTWGVDGHRLEHREEAFREVAIATATRAYDPSRHAQQ
jgi:hypothetical protein